MRRWSTDDEMIVWQQFSIYTRLPTLNELLDAAKTKYYSKTSHRYHYLYSSVVKSFYRALEREFVANRVQPIEGRLKIDLEFHVALDARRRRAFDPDNIQAGALKVLLDALQKAKLLRDDGWKGMDMPSPFGTSKFYREPKVPRTIVTLQDNRRPIEEDE